MSGARSGKRRWLALLAAIGALLFTSLGVWQVERLFWKLALIERVDARVHAAPVAAPGPDVWPRITGDADEYRHVTVTGRFLDARETLVQALTDQGAGYWVMTPLATANGTLLINRGFVPPERAATALHAAPSGDVRVTGLLRLSEPGGTLLRANRPAEGRWYSRDVAAIAQARGLGASVAPYFIDADATPNPGGWPIGGLTVVHFRNAHLIYALTWFALAVMCAFALIKLRDDTSWTHPSSP